MSGVELAACPFCGGEAREPIDYAGFTGCAAFGCPGSNVVALPEAWNRRAVPMEAVAWREKVALTTTPSGGGRPVTIIFSQVSSFNMTRCNDDERRVVMHGGETYRLRKSDADAILQALAVIPAPDTVSTKEGE